jgi:Sigma-70 region 2
MVTTQSGVVLRHLRHLVTAQDCLALPDRQLLDRFVHGREEAAFAALVRRHGPLVLGVCRRVLHHEQDAEDVFQATFLALARSARWPWYGEATTRFTSAPRSPRRS